MTQYYIFLDYCLQCDQPKEGLVTSPGKMDEYCQENNFTAWFETSARDNINIDDAAKALVEKVINFYVLSLIGWC